LCEVGDGINLLVKGLIDNSIYVKWLTDSMGP